MDSPSHISPRSASSPSVLSVGLKNLTSILSVDSPAALRLLAPPSSSRRFDASSSFSLYSFTPRTRSRPCERRSRLTKPFEGFQPVDFASIDIPLNCAVTKDLSHVRVKSWMRRFAIGDVAEFNIWTCKCATTKNSQHYMRETSDHSGCSFEKLTEHS